MDKYCNECGKDFTEEQTILSYGDTLFCDEDCVIKRLLWESRNHINSEIYSEDKNG